MSKLDILKIFGCLLVLDDALEDILMSWMSNKISWNWRGMGVLDDVLEDIPMSWMSIKISWNWRGMETRMLARCSSIRQGLDVLRDISDNIKLLCCQGIKVQRA